MISCARLAIAAPARLKISAPLSSLIPPQTLRRHISSLLLAKATQIVLESALSEAAPLIKPNVGWLHGGTVQPTVWQTHPLYVHLFSSNLVTKLD